MVADELHRASRNDDRVLFLKIATQIDLVDKAKLKSLDLLYDYQNLEKITKNTEKMKDLIT
jgi:hypothetical protein